MHLILVAMLLEQAPEWSALQTKALVGREVRKWSLG